jgi:tetratricopeptide (TPR) repeat protein
MQRPLCFVLMPFGRKPVTGGGFIDFDAVYSELVAPAIVAAGLEPLRADEEITGGIIHKPMFERLILCEFAVADLTTANANVFYELGLRHAVRHAGTVLLFARDAGQLPFDAALLGAMPYDLQKDGKPADLEKNRRALAEMLQAARKETTDSPVFQMIEEFPDIQRLKTDVFRDRVEYSEAIKKKLSAARRQKNVDAVARVALDLGNIADLEAGVVIDLFLSYRAVHGWDQMISLVGRMAPPLAATVMVQEQLALALNRAGRGKEAEQVLIELIARSGPSSETYGILGRVYRDRWEAALKTGDDLLATGLLRKAIDAYQKGFESDWRDAYPGVNAVTLMEIAEPPDSQRRELVAAVAYAVKRRMAKGQPDYWDHATLLELRVLAEDQQGSICALADALAAIRESWEPETTARNLRLIRQARERRGEKNAWVEQIEQSLLKQVY